MSRLGGLACVLVVGNSTDTFDSDTAGVGDVGVVGEEVVVGAFLEAGGLVLPTGFAFPFWEGGPFGRTPSSSSPTVIATVAAADDKEPI